MKSDESLIRLESGKIFFRHIFSNYLSAFLLFKPNHLFNINNLLDREK